MKIEQIELKNFRNYENILFTFKEKYAIIEGKNGTGKSTIKEAVLYCLYGRDLQGSTRLLDNLIRNGEKQATVSVDLGENKITRVKNQSKYILMLDDKSQDIKDAVVPQRDIDFILPNAELFQCIFDVGYFMTLAENDQRRLVLDNTPSIDRKTLYMETYKDEMSDEYEIHFGDYDQERMRYKRMADSVEKELEQLRTQALQDVIGYEELEKLRNHTETLEKQLEAMPTPKCDKCNQPISDKHYKDVYDATVISQNKLQTWERLYKQQQAEDNKGKFEQMEKQITDYREIYKRLSPGGMPAIEMAIKLKPIIKFLGKQIPGLKIETVKRIKTSIDWKECFEVFVGSVPYKRLSTGEKIKVDLAFSEMLNILTDRAVDMYFVDNYESVTGELPQVGGQLFLSQVVDGKALTVTEKGGE